MLLKTGLLRQRGLTRPCCIYTLADSDAQSAALLQHQTMSSKPQRLSPRVSRALSGVSSAENAGMPHSEAIDRVFTDRS